MRSTAAAILSATILLGASATVAYGLGPGHRRTPAADTSWESAVDLNTQPDPIGGDRRTLRFAGPVVTYRIDGDRLDEFTATIRDAFAVVAASTGLVVHETEDVADVVVIDKDGHDGSTTVWSRGGGVIVRAVVELGCCRIHSVYGSIARAFGPRGEHSSPGSVFGEDPTVDRPTDWDPCILRALYRVPPATRARVLRQPRLTGKAQRPRARGPTARGRGGEGPCRCAPA